MTAILIVMTLVAGPGAGSFPKAPIAGASSVAMQEFKSKQSCEVAKDIIIKNSASERTFAACVDNAPAQEASK